MTKFIPERPYKNTKSTAEKEFFYTLKQQFDIEDAYVFHSVNLPSHKNKIFGEADFLIVSPRGILCLEVKGGSVAYKNGEWEYKTKDGEPVDQDKNPFEQADDNILAVRKLVKETYNINGAHCFGYGVVFPDIHFNISTVEYPPQLVYDLGTENVGEYINGLYEYFYAKYGDKKRYPFTPEDLKEVVRCLRRDFTFAETLATKLEKAEKEIIRLTHQQARVLDCLKSNDHIAINGAAGTGKTVLAVEYAKKEAAKGKRVLFIAFNKNLVRSVRDDLKGCKNIDVYNIHNFFDQILPFSKKKFEELNSEYYNTYWPEKCYDILGDMSDEEKEKYTYDVLVIDEAQDIIAVNYIMVMDMLLKGGFKNGRWAIFYDEKQNIYNENFDEGIKMLKENNFLIYDLTINCRNTQNIAAYNSAVTETEMPELNDNLEGEDVEFIGYDSIDELRLSVKNLLKKWNAAQLDKSNVVFLSPTKYSKSDLNAAMGSNFKINKLNDDYIPQYNVPIYSTIHGFKGLDSAIIVLLDADKIYSGQYSRLLYTAISRAKAKLYILSNNKSIDKLKRS